MDWTAIMLGTLVGTGAGVFLLVISGVTRQPHWNAMARRMQRHGVHGSEEELEAALQDSSFG